MPGIAGATDRGAKLPGHPSALRAPGPLLRPLCGLALDQSLDWQALTETGEYTVNGITITCGEIDETEDFNARFKTSADAEILGENHIGYDWAEIDWAHANEGYVRVKLNEEFTKYTECHVRWLENKHITSSKGYYISTVYKLETGTWLNIPLPAGSNDYAVDIHPIPGTVDGDLTDEELDVITSKNLVARFTAEIENPNAAWLVSTIDIDYENAPLTCPKPWKSRRTAKRTLKKSQLCLTGLPRTSSTI